MLTTDSEWFEREFHGAWKFIVAAGLRKEAYNYLSMSSRSAWEQDRLDTLMRSAAVQEPWFVAKVLHDFGYEVPPLTETTDTETTDSED